MSSLDLQRDESDHEHQIEDDCGIGSLEISSPDGDYYE